MPTQKKIYGVPQHPTPPPPPPSWNIWSSSGYIKIMNFCIIFSFHVSRPQFPPRLLDIVNPIRCEDGKALANAKTRDGILRIKLSKHGERVCCIGEGGGGGLKRMCKLNIEALHISFAFLLPYIIGHICIYLQKSNDGRKTFILLLATYILLEGLSVLLWGEESESNLCQWIFFISF